MTTLTKEYFEQHLEKTLDKRLEATTERILGFVKEGFDEVDKRFTEQGNRIERLERNLASLTSSVDRFVKMYADQNQEIVILRKQLHSIETRLKKLEMQRHA